MAKGIVIYYSRSGNTKEMGETIAKAMNDTGLKTECKPVDKVKPDDLPGMTRSSSARRAITGRWRPR